jgi:hypothetical protein
MLHYYHETTLNKQTKRPAVSFLVSKLLIFMEKRDLGGSSVDFTILWQFPYCTLIVLIITILPTVVLHYFSLCLYASILTFCSFLACVIFALVAFECRTRWQSCCPFSFRCWVGLQFTGRGGLFCSTSA